MSENPLRKLESYGQSIWMDYIRRQMLASGELQGYIDEDGVTGITSNPSIFEKAISGSHDYDESIRALALEGKSIDEMYLALVKEDIRWATDIFRLSWDRLSGRDGFVSLEVSPGMAHDTNGTIAEARRLWAMVDRPNVMIKVPATKEGLPAIRQLTSEGINVNITLLFGLPRYREVAEAYISGLEDLSKSGRPINQVASVASFFLSRIDVLLDPVLEQIIQTGGPQKPAAERAHGQIAIASARVAYQIYEEVFNSERFRHLMDLGARPQRLLWASTSTKNPAYSDVKYVDALIGPQTIDTVPVETLNAYRDHGNPAPRLGQGLDEAHKVLDSLPGLGIDLQAATQQLEDEGVQKFTKSFDELMAALKDKQAKALQEPLDRQSFQLAGSQSGFEKQVQSLADEHFSERLWRKDASLWKSDPQEQKQIRDALGWLHVAEKMEENVHTLHNFLAEVRNSGMQHVVLMGMGGSSLAPIVFKRTFPVGQEGLPVDVLDSTDPATILDLEHRIPVADTLFIVSSKSGTTTEPLAFNDYFYAKVKSLRGERAGQNFAAITDPGTPLVQLAQDRRYRKVFTNFADIGGRYSALSYFGLVPAALMGLDVEEILIQALRMVHACEACVPAGENPGLTLGAALGELALQNRDKVTFLMPAPVRTFGLWLEQLLAESTGKEGKGLIPVANEPPGNPSVYGQDRFFVYTKLMDTEDAALDSAVSSLQSAGQPVATILMDRLMDISQEFFRWEFATAVAGAVLGINPFDQPNVQESKDNTKRLLDVVMKQGKLPEKNPALVQRDLQLYAQRPASNLSQALQEFLDQAKPGDYVALQAYLTENEANDQALQTIRLRLRDHLHLATTLGYGPRFLHSTGQLHKGGPNTGLFIQLTCQEDVDVPIPNSSYTFGVLKQAQALGDLQALRKHGRRAIRIDLGKNAVRGLAELDEALQSALAGITA